MTTADSLSPPMDPAAIRHTHVDPDTCTGCGTCVEVCPTDTLVLDGDVARAEGEHCLGCEHCAAVCPVEALDVTFVQHDALALNTVEARDAWLAQGEADVPALVQLMRSRRSCRAFEDEAVPREVLQDMVTIGATAPSGTNRQAWSFTVLSSRDAVMTLAEAVLGFFERIDKLAANPLVRFGSRFTRGDPLGTYWRQYHERVSERIAQYRATGRDRLFHGAPAVIVVSSRPGGSTSGDDALLATQNILLAAHAMGYGSCLVGYAVQALRRDAGVRQAAGIPDDETVRAVIALGSSSRRYLRLTGRAKPPVRFVD
jgi:nitroreductase/ferredoxin